MTNPDELKAVVDFQNFLQVEAIIEAKKGDYNFSHDGTFVVDFIVDSFRKYLNLKK